MKKIVCPKCGATVAEISEAEWSAGQSLNCACGLRIEIKSPNGGTMNITMDEIHPKGGDSNVL